MHMVEFSHNLLLFTRSTCSWYTLFLWLKLELNVSMDVMVAVIVKFWSGSTRQICLFCLLLLLFILQKLKHFKMSFTRKRINYSLVDPNRTWLGTLIPLIRSPSYAIRVTPLYWLHQSDILRVMPNYALWVTPFVLSS